MCCVWDVVENDNLVILSILVDLITVNVSRMAIHKENDPIKFSGLPLIFFSFETLFERSSMAQASVNSSLDDFPDFRKRIIVHPSK